MKNTAKTSLAKTTLEISAAYRQFIEDLKARVAAARISAARAVNNEAILLYWDIGRGIVEKQKTDGWGDAVVEMVAEELRRAFPAMTGFSPRNVWDMRRLYATYTDSMFLAEIARENDRRDGDQILRQAVAEFGGIRNRPHAVAKLATHDASSVILRQPAAELVAEGNPIPFLQQLVAEVPWGHNLLILYKLTDPAARLWYLRATARFGWSRNVLLNQIKAIPA